MLNDTIVAISTALNNHAISIVRMSGDDAIEITNKIFTKDLNKVGANQIVYGHIVENGQYVDEVMVAVFKGPKSYTREDIIDAKLYMEPEIIDEYIAKYQKIADPELKFELLFAGTVAKNEKVLDKMLKLLSEPEIVKPEQVIARVEGFHRKGKDYSVTHKGYGLWTWIWVGLFPIRRPLIALRRRLGRIRRALKRK